jgi:hypothetical protein
MVTVSTIETYENFRTGAYAMPQSGDGSSRKIVYLHGCADPAVRAKKAHRLRWLSRGHQQDDGRSAFRRGQVRERPLRGASRAVPAFRWNVCF